MDPRESRGRTPRETAAALEAGAFLPAGDAERFNGYGVIGVPFISGHVLALRRWPASPVGPGHTSVWHRDPGGRWTFYANVEPELACARYTGRIAGAAPVTEITIGWTGPLDFTVRVPEAGLEWRVRLGSTLATRALSRAAALLPEALWSSPPALSLLGRVAGVALRAGRVGLQGRMPNGQWFRASPRRIWIVEASGAVLRGEDLGEPARLPEQARVGDFWIPRRGLFAFGQAHVEPLDRARHAFGSAAATRAGAAGTPRIVR